MVAVRNSAQIQATLDEIFLVFLSPDEKYFQILIYHPLLCSCAMIRRLRKDAGSCHWGDFVVAPCPYSRMQKDLILKWATAYVLSAQSVICQLIWWLLVWSRGLTELNQCDLIATKYHLAKGETRMMLRLTDSVEESSSWEADRRSDRLEIYISPPSPPLKEPESSSPCPHTDPWVKPDESSVPRLFVSS